MWNYLSRNFLYLLYRWRQMTGIFSLRVENGCEKEKKSLKEPSGRTGAEATDCFEALLPRCMWETLWICNEPSLLANSSNRCYARAVISHRRMWLDRDRQHGTHAARAASLRLDRPPQTASRLWAAGKFLQQVSHSCPDRWDTWGWHAAPLQNCCRGYWFVRMILIPTVFI